MIVGDHRGRAAQDVSHLGVVRFQQGQELVAQPVAVEGGVQIGAVEAGLQAMLLAVGLDLGARDFQQGAHQPQPAGIGPLIRRQQGQPQRVQRRHGQHAPQAGQARAAQPVHEHGLRLVVGVVPHGDGAGADAPGDARQEPVASLARRLFRGDAGRRGQGGHIRPLHGAVQSPGRGRLGHEGGVGVRFGAADAMMEVGHVKLQIVLGLQLAQDVQQAEGIGAARNPHHDPLARGPQVVPLHSLSHLAQQLPALHPPTSVLQLPTSILQLATLYHSFSLWDNLWYNAR